jgi:hypothetical protein
VRKGKTKKESSRDDSLTIQTQARVISKESKIKKAQDGQDSNAKRNKESKIKEPPQARMIRRFDGHDVRGRRCETDESGGC